VGTPSEQASLDFLFEPEPTPTPIRHALRDISPIVRSDSPVNPLFGIDYGDLHFPPAAEYAAQMAGGLRAHIETLQGAPRAILSPLLSMALDEQWPIFPTLNRAYATAFWSSLFPDWGRWVNALSQTILSAFRDRSDGCVSLVFGMGDGLALGAPDRDMERLLEGASVDRHTVRARVDHAIQLFREGRPQSDLPREPRRSARPTTGAARRRDSRSGSGSGSGSEYEPDDAPGSPDQTDSASDFDADAAATWCRGRGGRGRGGRAQAADTTRRGRGGRAQAAGPAGRGRGRGRPKGSRDAKARTQRAQPRHVRDAIELAVQGRLLALAARGASVSWRVEVRCPPPFSFCVFCQLQNSAFFCFWVFGVLGAG
jgi:hypothetical protein